MDDTIPGNQKEVHVGDGKTTAQQTRDDSVFGDLISSAKIPSKGRSGIVSYFKMTGDPNIDKKRCSLVKHFRAVASSRSHERVPRRLLEADGTSELIKNGTDQKLDPSLVLSAREATLLSVKHGRHQNLVIPKEGLPTLPLTGGDHDKHGNVPKINEDSMLDISRTSGRYSGQLFHSMPNGFGTMTYTNGTVYEGLWRYGKWHGMGNLALSCGDRYEGNYDINRRFGFGVYRWRDGRVYAGEFKNDRRHGWGTYKWKDGSIYRGEFANGRRSGVGSYTFPDGSIYRGEWRNGKFQGFGEMQWVDGRSYEGEWNDGHAHGNGKGSGADGSVLHDGEWSKDTPV